MVGVSSPLNCGGLRRSEDKAAGFFALMVEKCGICFPFWPVFGICCYLKRVFHTMVKRRRCGSQAHEVIGRAASAPPNERGGPVSQGRRSSSGRSGSSAGATASTGVVTSVGIDQIKKLEETAAVTQYCVKTKNPPTSCWVRAHAPSERRQKEAQFELHTLAGCVRQEDPPFVSPHGLKTDNCETLLTSSLLCLQDADTNV